MTPRNLAEIVLRKENFGGIVFNASSGVHLELDAEAFELAKRFFVLGTPAERGFPSGFLRGVMSKLHIKNTEFSARLVSHDVQAVQGARMYSAPTLVDFQITSRCTQGCPHCYASSGVTGIDVAFGDVLKVLDDSANAGVLQMALGGGDPLLHPNICEILVAAREHGIVPNLTTSGAYFSTENLLAIKEHCGAAALSIEAVGERFSARRRLGFLGFLQAVALLREFRVPTVFQVVVSAENLVDIPSIVDLALEHDLYGVIFLAYKPVGRGVAFDAPLSAVPASQVAHVLAEAFRKLSGHTRVGYDCCLSPVVAGMNVDVFGLGNEDLEGCSALRGSVGVSAALDVHPCTFLEKRVLGSLHKSSLLSIWHGSSAMAFRSNHQRVLESRPECQKCRHASGCFGGCPEMDLGFCTFR